MLRIIRDALLRIQVFRGLVLCRWELADIWCCVAGSSPMFRVKEVLSSLRAEGFKIFLRNGSGGGT
jgi:hypothetical protein